MEPRFRGEGKASVAPRPGKEGPLDLILAELAAGVPDGAGLTRMVLRLAAAVLCASVVGLQREQHGKPAGLRTHMLVALGSALFVLIAVEAGLDGTDLSRVIQGLVTGIGFLGAGAILKREQERDIKGLTTAAGIWMVAGIGVAAGLGLYVMALLATALAWVILALLGHLERPDGRHHGG